MKKIALCIVLLLNGCYSQNDNEIKDNKSIKKEVKMLKSQKTEKVQLGMGESFKDFYLIYNQAKVKRVGDDKWGYTTFYTYNWSTKKPANISILDQENIILDLPNTIYMMLTEESEDSKKGIKKIQLQTGITQADLLPYEEAKVRFHDFLQKLLKAGWKRAIRYSQPRISGRHAMHYKLTEDDMYYQDPAYEPTLEEWKKLETGGMSSSNYWVLHYKNKIFLEINLGVVPHKTDPELASYLMFITIRDGEEEAMSYTKERLELKWKETYQEDNKRYSEFRQKIETKLKAKGYTIDENYEDYMIEPKSW